MSRQKLNDFRKHLAGWIEAHLTSGVQIRYAKARAEFEDWCVRESWDIESLPAGEIDVIIARFVLHAKEDHDDLLTRQGCLDLMATMQRRLGAKLHLTHQVMKLWHKETPPRQAEALPLVVAYAAVIVLSEVMKNEQAAFVVMVAFSGCLRIGEALQLRMCDVVVPRVNGPQVVVLILRATKRGFDQRVVLGNPVVVEAIKRYLMRRGAVDDMAMAAPLTYPQFMKAFNQVIALLRLPGDCWRSHSLRRGGATALMEAGWTFDNVKQYGRWASDSSAREYIRLGQTALVRLSRAIPEQQWRSYEVLAGGCGSAFKGLTAAGQAGE